MKERLLELRNLILQQFRPLHSGSLCEQWPAVTKMRLVSKFCLKEGNLSDKIHDNNLMGHLVNGDWDEVFRPSEFGKCYGIGAKSRREELDMSKYTRKSKPISFSSFKSGHATFVFFQFEAQHSKIFLAFSSQACSRSHSTRSNTNLSSQLSNLQSNSNIIQISIKLFYLSTNPRVK